MKKLYCGQPGPDQLVLVISNKERAAFDALPPGRTGAQCQVLDRATGHLYRVRRARCGLDCYCAAHAERIATP